MYYLYILKYLFTNIVKNTNSLNTTLGIRGCLPVTTKMTKITTKYIRKIMTLSDRGHFSKSQKIVIF